MGKQAFRTLVLSFEENWLKQVGDLLSPLGIAPAWASIYFPKELQSKDCIARSIEGLQQLTSPATTSELARKGVEVFAFEDRLAVLTIIFSPLSDIARAAEVVNALKDKPDKPAFWLSICLVYIDADDTFMQDVPNLAKHAESFSLTVLLSRKDGLGALWSREAVFKGSAHWTKLLVARCELARESWSPMQTGPVVPRIASVKMLHRFCPTEELEGIAGRILQAELLEYLVPTDVDVQPPHQFPTKLENLLDVNLLQEQVVLSGERNLLAEVEEIYSVSASFYDYPETLSALLEVWESNHIPQAGQIATQRCEALQKQAFVSLSGEVSQSLNKENRDCLRQTIEELKSFRSLCSEKSRGLYEESLRLARSATESKSKLEQNRQTLMKATKAVPYLVTLIIVALLSLASLYVFGLWLATSPESSWRYYLAAGLVPLFVIGLHVWAILSWWSGIHNMWTHCKNLLAEVAANEINSLAFHEISTYLHRLAGEGENHIKQVQNLLSRLEAMKKDLPERLEPSPELVFRRDDGVDASILNEANLEILNGLLKQNVERTVKDIMDKLSPTSSWMDSKTLEDDLGKASRDEASDILGKVPLAKLYTEEQLKSDLKLASPWLLPELWWEVPASSRHIFAGPKNLPELTSADVIPQSPLQLYDVDGERNEVYMLFFCADVQLPKQ